MRLLIALTYYRPHISGLTIYAERLARALVKRGHQITVLTSQYDKMLSTDEVVDGVHIIRVPVAFRLSKGVVMPGFGFTANRLVREHDALHLHLPQFDAAGLALRGRFLKKPTIVTYHCDLLMPSGMLNFAANKAVNLMNNLSAQLTHQIVTYTQDYGENSPFLKRYLKKLKVVQPPVELPDVTQAEIRQFAQFHNPKNRRPVIGMAARFATEKGVEVLLNALPQILQVYPNALVQFSGPYHNIIGEESYFKKLEPRIQKYQESGVWQYLGMLDPNQMADFYPNIDVLVLPSLNSTESFGLVQIEAMINGKPCVASDLPGVRQPVTMHKMGKVIPIGDHHALAQAILDIVADPKSFKNDPEIIKNHYSPLTVAEAYEELFKEIQMDLNDRGFQS